ncbi:hypothetical protein LY90DRAFT_636149 [Neocallimastix californiae]|uniref:Uncharacterized protein n=1 Tax=Neocallimastix californiae TaxID=1754190 RepID=A0A1Y1ZXX1_9FUNG|nr:hypothetical protein LY90DRAFT_636149 [Neocallimastix californiae]|eukprot:ORY15101.1 hypothetical protein LY90DRAFT_636149 [Neocallimastix californiae]
MQKINLSNAYLQKQNTFVALVKEVQFSLISKEYKKQGYSLNEFIKMKWNISQAQAYRYLICAKVLDQLKEFEIKPSYERLCRSLYNNAKTSSQMKLLWSTVLIKAGGRPDFINSTHISKTWKELSQNKQYDDICHFEDNIINKIEKSLNKVSKEKKHKQLHLNKSNSLNSLNSLNHSKSLNSQITNIPSPTLFESSNLTSNETLNVENSLKDESLLTPISNYSSLSNDDFQTNSISQIEPIVSSSIPIFSTVSSLPSNPSISCISSISSTEPLYYLTTSNELMNGYEQPLIYIQEPSQQIIYYY